MRHIVEEYGEAIFSMIIGLMLAGVIMSAFYFITVNL